MKWINTKQFFVSQPYVSRHLGHFTESVNHALLKLRFPSAYLPLTDLFFPTFPVDKVKWTNAYLKLLLSLYPDNMRPLVHLPGSIPIDTLTCFRTAV